MNCVFTFVEREENVKADIFYAYITLLKQTKPSVVQDSDSMDHEEGYFSPYYIVKVTNYLICIELCVQSWLVLVTSGIECC